MQNETLNEILGKTPGWLCDPDRPYFVPQ